MNNVINSLSAEVNFNILCARRGRCFVCNTGNALGRVAKKCTTFSAVN